MKNIACNINTKQNEMFSFRFINWLRLYYSVSCKHNYCNHWLSFHSKRKNKHENNSTNCFSLVSLLWFSSKNCNVNGRIWISTQGEHKSHFLTECVLPSWLQSVCPLFCFVFNCVNTFFFFLLFIPLVSYELYNIK